MKLTREGIGSLTLAVAQLKSVDVLTGDEAAQAYQRIQAISEKIVSSSNDLVSNSSRHHKYRRAGSLIDYLPEDSKLKEILSESVLRQINHGKVGKLLLLLFENEGNDVVDDVILREVWGGGAKSKTVIGPRIRELRDIVEPHISIERVENGYKLSIPSN